MSVDRSEVGRTARPAVQLAPDGWPAESQFDPLITQASRLIGTPISRIDGPLKVRGQATFAAEVPLPGLVYAALAYSSIAHGRIATLETRDAEAAAGVVLVMTYRNAPRLQPTPLFNSSADAAGPDDLPVMQDERIHWNGQPIAVVLAETQEQAEYAASLIRARFHSEPATIAFDLARAHARTPNQVLGEPAKLEIGDAEAALAAAPYKVDAVYRTPRHNHNAIELHAVTVAWQGEELTVHDASQLVSRTAWTLAQVFGIDASKVRVRSPFVGGGFGGKCLWNHQILAAAAAKLAGRPVRLVLSREGVYRLVGGRTMTEQRVAIAARDDGRFDALIHTGMAAMTPHNDCPEQFTFPARHLYAAGSFKLLQQVVDLPMLANTFMRAPGESVGTFALECAIDELAEQMEMDPIELRVRNEPDRDPTSGRPFSSRHLVEAYRAGASRFGWSRRASRPRARREGEWLLGIGCATATYPYYRMPGGSARITLTRDGHVTVEVAAHEMGMGTATIHSQVIAERLGLPLSSVTVTYGDSTLSGSFIAGGSSQTASVGGAVMAAQRQLVAELLRLAGEGSALAGLEVDQVGCRDGALCKLSEPSSSETYVGLLERVRRDSLTVAASAPPSSEMQQWSMHSFGAQFAEVRVNTITGEIRVDRFLGSFDCGRIINPKTAASQFRGGIIMGIGLALMEETQFDERTGRITNPSLSDYHVPVQMDVPEIDVIWTDLADPHTPMGAHGIGEIGITGVGAAVANAVYNATGKRIRDLPITLDKLVMAAGSS